VLSQGELHDAVVNFGTYQSLQQYRRFHCKSTAFELNHGKITVLNMSIYCL